MPSKWSDMSDTVAAVTEWLGNVPPPNPSPSDGTAPEIDNKHTKLAKFELKKYMGIVWELLRSTKIKKKCHHNSVCFHPSYSVLHRLDNLINHLDVTMNNNDIPAVIGPDVPNFSRLDHRHDPADTKFMQSCMSAAPSTYPQDWQRGERHNRPQMGQALQGPLELLELFIAYLDIWLEIPQILESIGKRTRSSKRPTASRLL